MSEWMRRKSPEEIWPGLTAEIKKLAEDMKSENAKAVYAFGFNMDAIPGKERPSRCVYCDKSYITPSSAVCLICKQCGDKLGADMLQVIRNTMVVSTAWQYSNSQELSIEKQNLHQAEITALTATRKAAVDALADATTVSDRRREILAKKQRQILCLAAIVIVLVIALILK